MQVEEESSGNAGNREQAKKVENVNTNWEGEEKKKGKEMQL